MKIILSKLDLYGLAKYYNWAVCKYDNNNVLVYNFSTTAENNWQPVTKQQLDDYFKNIKTYY